MYKKEDIMLGLISVISLCRNDKERVELVKHICQPFGESLLGMYKNWQSHGGKILMSNENRVEYLKGLVFNFASLVTVVKNVPPAREGALDHEFCVILKELWPLIEFFLDVHFEDASVIEIICQFLKYTMRCIGTLFNQVFDQYIKIVVKNYEKKPVSTYLYTVETLVTLFGKHDVYHQQLSGLFNHMIACTYTHLTTQQISDIRRIDPDLLDDYFGLITRYLRYYPSAVLTSPSLVVYHDLG